MIDMSDPRITAKVRDLHRDATSAGYEDPIFGALVIAAAALVGLGDEMAAGRHPKGKGAAAGGGNGTGTNCADSRADTNR